MKKQTIRGWTKQLPFGERTVVVYYVLPDTFFDFELFMCPTCGALFGVDREAAFYQDRPFETLRTQLSCPECASSLGELVEYPQTFRYPNGTEGHYVPPPVYPPDSELVTFEVWDPYA